MVKIMAFEFNKLRQLTHKLFNKVKENLNGHFKVLVTQENRNLSNEQKLEAVSAKLDENLKQIYNVVTQVSNKVILISRFRQCDTTTCSIIIRSVETTYWKV